MQALQTEKLWDYKSLLQSSLHVGLQQHPSRPALTSGRSCIWASHTLGSAQLAAPTGGGRQSPTALPIPASPHWVPHPTVKPTTTTSLTTQPTVVTLRATNLSKQPEALWDGKMLWSCCILYVQGGLYRKESAIWLQMLLPFLCLCSVIFQTGMTEAWSPRGPPDCWPQGSCPRGHSHRLSGDCSAKFPVIRKKPIHLDRLLCWLDCVQGNGATQRVPLNEAHS